MVLETLTKLEVLRLEARRYGLHVARYSPGDGVTRYKFFDGSDITTGTNFFSGDGLHTALGFKEALKFINAVGIGIRMGKASCEAPKGGGRRDGKKKHK